MTAFPVSGGRDGARPSRQVKADMDGKKIGILLCKSPNDIVAEYSLADLDKPIGVSTYRLGLPPLEQLQVQLRKLLTERKKGGTK